MNKLTTVVFHHPSQIGHFNSHLGLGPPSINKLIMNLNQFTKDKLSNSHYGWTALDKTIKRVESLCLLVRRLETAKQIEVISTGLDWRIQVG